jgi:hypothetical protein
MEKRGKRYFDLTELNTTLYVRFIRKQILERRKERKNERKMKQHRLRLMIDAVVLRYHYSHTNLLISRISDH